MHVLVNNSSED